MSQYEDQEEIQTKEWEEALSIIENIFKDYKEKGTPNKTVTKADPLAVDVARWKVVWGKKPAQYRLKPFLMWSVDEMPSIPEECESFPEHFGNSKESNDNMKIRNDKKLRLMRRKIFKMNRRVDEINVLLVHAAEEAKYHQGEEEGNGAGCILTEATRAELIVERNVILDKLRKTKKKLIALKNEGVEQKKLALMGQDESKETQRADASGDSRRALSLSLDPENSDALNFKHGRRAAIKKEIRTNAWTKVVNGPLKDNSPRRSESLDEDKKTKKKKFCRKHHRKMLDKSGLPGCENEASLGRRALSETDIARVVKELNERGLQKCETTEVGDRDKIAGGSCKDPRGNGLQKNQQCCQTDFSLGTTRLQRIKNSEFSVPVTAAVKSDKDTAGNPPSTFCATTQINSLQSKTRKDRILRLTSDETTDPSDLKRFSEPGKLTRVKKCPPPFAKEPRPKAHARSKSETKELPTKVRTQKMSETAVKMES